jgi:NADH-quinone oxidoreductase subunit J
MTGKRGLRTKDERMALQAIAFYLLALVTLGAGLAVVSARNPVHSVLFLILAFFSAAGLFVLLGAEFLAMLLVVVYVGAVAVLFLFVVMMLDVDFAALRQGFARYMPLGGLVAGALALEMVVVAATVATKGAARLNETPMANGDGVSVTNAEAIGRVLYTDYIYFFQAAGMVLLVAMIGAIVLTLRHKPGVRRQVVADQVLRSPKTGMRLVDLKPGQGIEP